MEKIGSVVHDVVEAAGVVRAREAEVQNAVVRRRLPGGSVPTRESGDREGLHGGKQGVEKAVRERATAPLEKAAGEGSAGGITEV